MDQRGRAEALQDIDQHDRTARGLDDLMANHLLAGIVAALTSALGLIRVISSIGVPSSKMTTRSTASSAASTSARARSSWTGRSAPFSRRTEASLFRPTIR